MPIYEFSRGGRTWEVESPEDLSPEQLKLVAEKTYEPEKPKAPATFESQALSALKAANPLDPFGGLAPTIAGAITPDIVKRGAKAAVAGVSDLLQIPREWTTDKFARVGSRLAGIAVPDVPGPDGRPHSPTAPELLMEGLMPPKEPGGRATSRDYAVGMLDAIPGVDFETAQKYGPFAEALLPPSLQLAGSLGNLDAAVARRNGKGAKAAEVVEDLARVPAGIAAGAATDPLTGLGAVATGRALGAKTPLALARLGKADQALAATGAVIGGSGSLGEGQAAQEAAERGDLEGAATHGLSAALMAGMAGLGVKGASEIGAATKALKGPAGRPYVDDPLLTADQRAALLAEDRAALRAAAQESVGAARQALADFGEVDPLQITPINQALDPKASRARAAEAVRQATREDALARGVDAAQAEAQAIASGQPEGPLSAAQEFERTARDRGLPDPAAEASLAVLRERLMNKLREGSISAEEVRVLLRIPEQIARVEAAKPGRTPARAVERVTLATETMDDAAAAQLRSIREKIAQRIESGERTAPQDAAAIGEIDAFLGDRMRLQTQAAAEAARQAVTVGSPEADSALAMTLADPNAQPSLGSQLPRLARPQRRYTTDLAESVTAHEGGVDAVLAQQQMPWELSPEQYARENPHAWRPGARIEERAAGFDALPEDAEVWVFHGTTDKAGEGFAKHGIRANAKPVSLGRQRYESGEDAHFGPGSGLGGGLYVATDPMNATGYGRRVLAIRVKKGDVQVSPEQATLGERSRGTALAHSDAMVVGDIAPDRIIDLGTFKREGRTALEEFKDFSSKLPPRRAPGPPERAEPAEPFQVGSQRTVAAPEGPTRPVAATTVRPGGELFGLSPRAAEVAGVEAPISPIRTRASVIRDVLEARAAASRQAKARLDEAARARGEKSRLAEVAREAEVGDLPARQALDRVLERGGTQALKATQTHLENIPVHGPEVAGRLRAAQFQEEQLGGAFWGGVRGVLEDVIPGNDRAQAILFQNEVAPVLDGAVKFEAISTKGQRAVLGIRQKLDGMWTALEDAYRSQGLEPPKKETNYLPRIKKGQSLAEIDQAARELAEKHHASIEDAEFAIRYAKPGKTPEEILKLLREGENVPGTSGVVVSRADRVRRFEKERVPNQPLKDFRTDLGVLQEYGQVMARRIAELKHLGRNGEAVQALIDRMSDAPAKVLGLTVGDKAFAQAIVDRTRGVKPVTAGQQAAGLARTLLGAQGLVFSSLQQPLTLAQISAMSMHHPVAAARGVQGLLFDGIKRGDLVHPIRMAKQIRQSYRRAGIKAEEVGAVTANTAEEIAAAFGLDASARQETVAGKIAGKAQGLPHIRALAATDRAMRIVGAKVGEFVVPKMVEAAKKGSGSEQRALAYMGIDWKNYKGTPEELATAMKLYADETNFRPNILRLPPAASSPIGRFGFQYASFMHQMTKFQNFLLKNPERLAAFAAVGLPLAHLSNQARFTLKGTPYDDRPVADEDFGKVLGEVTKGQRRVDWTKGKNEAQIAAIHALASLGVGAIYQSMLERSGEGKITDLVPIARVMDRTFSAVAGSTAEAVQLRTAIAAAEAEGNEAEAGRLRAALQKAEGVNETQVAKAGAALVPGPWVSEAVRETTGELKPPVPGWFGRLRDVAEERGIVTPSDPTQAGSAGREAVRRLVEMQAERSRARGQGEAMLTPQPSKTLGEKLETTEKSALREKYRLAIIKAIQDEDYAEVWRLRREARKLKIKFGRKSLRSLEGRVIRPTEDDYEQDQEEEAMTQ